MRCAGAEILAFADFPKQHWKQIWSDNPQERLNKEVRPRTDVVGIFPNRKAVTRIVGAALAEMNDEWAEVRRSVSFEASSAATKPERTTPAPRKEAHKQLPVAA